MSTKVLLLSELFLYVSYFIYNKFYQLPQSSFHYSLDRYQVSLGVLYSYLQVFEYFFYELKMSF